MTTRPLGPPHDPLIGAILADRYRILRQVGRGGMGVVYEAQHVVIEKRIAVKVLAEGLAARPELVQRFMQEARAASRIGHENIVDVTDVGQAPNGSVCIAMEYLDGCDLAQELREKGPMPWARAKPILLQVCRALGAAHQKGIIHRDLKPENVFLCERAGRKDFVKVLDFGIAKMNVGDQPAEQPALTKAGVILGTPEYMSPEQASGVKIDHRADVYAVGVILCEMLTGAVPFQADTFMGILSKHMFSEPQAPSQLRPDLEIPPEVDVIVLRALQKDRDKRFQSMTDFHTAIEGCGGPGRSSGDVPQVGGASLDAARRDTLVGEVAQWRLTRGRWVVGVAGVAALLVAGAFVWLVGRSTRVPPRVVPRAVVQPTPARPPAPRVVQISLRSVPPGATVSRGDTVEGMTPLTLSLPWGSEPVPFTLRRRGYRDLLVEVVPDDARDYVRELRRLPPARSKIKAKGQPPDAPSKSTAAPVNSKLRDLKDPFGD